VFKGRERKEECPSCLDHGIRVLVIIYIMRVRVWERWEFLLCGWKRDVVPSL